MVRVEVAEVVLCIVTAPVTVVVPARLKLRLRALEAVGLISSAPFTVKPPVAVYALAAVIVGLSVKLL